MIWGMVYLSIVVIGIATYVGCHLQIRGTARRIAIAIAVTTATVFFLNVAASNHSWKQFEDRDQTRITRTKWLTRDLTDYSSWESTDRSTTTIDGQFDRQGRKHGPWEYYNSTREPFSYDTETTYYCAGQEITAAEWFAIDPGRHATIERLLGWILGSVLVLVWLTVYRMLPVAEPKQPVETITSIDVNQRSNTGQDKAKPLMAKVAETTAKPVPKPPVMIGTTR
jgi:hypothetical protein